MNDTTNEVEALKARVAELEATKNVEFWELILAIADPDTKSYIRNSFIGVLHHKIDRMLNKDTSK